jgi:hypothetical protein
VIDPPVCPRCESRPSKFAEQGALCWECSVAQLAERPIPTVDDLPFRILTPREWREWKEKS